MRLSAVPGHVTPKKDRYHSYQTGDIVYGKVPETSRSKFAGVSFRGRLMSVQYRTNQYGSWDAMGRRTLRRALRSGIRCMGSSPFTLI
jgi:hypothetical protein